MHLFCTVNDAFLQALHCSTSRLWKFVDVPAKSAVCEDHRWKFPGYSVHNVAYDGQCGFSVIGHQLAVKKYKSTNDVSGDIVRSDIVAFIASNQQLRSDMSERLQAQGMSIDGYILHMSKGTTWIDDTALYAASLLYDMTIDILREGCSKPVVIGSSTCGRSVTLGFVSSGSNGNPDHYVSLIAATGIVRVMTLLGFFSHAKILVCFCIVICCILFVFVYAVSCLK